MGRTGQRGQGLEKNMSHNVKGLHKLPSFLFSVWFWLLKSSMTEWSFVYHYSVQVTTCWKHFPQPFSCVSSPRWGSQSKTAMVTIYPVSFPLQIIPQLFRSFPRHYSPFSLTSLETLWLMTRSTLVSLQLQEAMCPSRQVWGRASSLVCGSTEPGKLYLLWSSSKLPGGCSRKIKNHFFPVPGLPHQEQSKGSPWTSTEAFYPVNM